MPGRNLTTLNVALTATLGPFAKAFKGAEGVVAQFGSRIKGALLSPLAALTGALSAGALIAGLKKTAEHIDALAKAADRLGISTQALAGLQHAAALSGASSEQLAAGMERLTKTVQDASQGSKEASKSIRELGLKVSDLAGLNAAEQFTVVADAVNKLGTSGAKTAAVMSLFGKGNTELLSVLQEGSAGLAKMTQEAEKLGIAVSRADASKVEEAGDAMTRVGEVIQGVFNKAVVAISPWVTAVANAFVQTAKDANGFGAEIDKVMKVAVRAGGFIADTWWGLKIVFEGVKAGLLYLGATYAAFGDAAVKVVEWIGIKFIQLNDLATSASNTMCAAITVAWNALKIPVAAFVQFAAGQLAHLLEASATVAARFDDDLTYNLTAAAGQVRAATGAMQAEAAKDLAQSTTNVKQAAKETADATTALFSSVQLQGSEMLQQLSQDFITSANAAADSTKVMARQDAPSVAFEAKANEIQAFAQVQAQARADEVLNQQKAADTAAKINAEGVRQHQESWLQYYNWEKSTRAENLQHSLSSTSSFFGNLSSLQQSHDKTQRKIGKAAAKAKIVTDTATAAMGAYSAMAAIPYVGPALGVIAAAAAIAAGAIQLSNVDKSDSGTIGGAAAGAPDASSSLGGGAGPRGSGQTLILQGELFTPEMLMNAYETAKERGYVIEGVRRG